MNETMPPATINDRRKEAREQNGKKWVQLPRDADALIGACVRLLADSAHKLEIVALPDRVRVTVTSPVGLQATAEHALPEAAMRLVCEERGLL